MFGNLGEMAKMMQKAKDIQKNMATMKEELAQAEFSGSAPGNQVNATVTGDFRVRCISIAHEASGDRELLETQVMVAVNNALDAARQAMQKKMSDATGGLKLPDIF